MGQRRHDSMVRHLCSCMIIEEIDAGNASGVSYMTLYRHFGSASKRVPMIAPEMVAEYHDRFTLTTEGWRISDRQGFIVLKHAASTH